ncbi:small subunit ribosomal protein S29e [Enteropsectra breve]|nr:small subunit ribosomal protein S29e [Enteropsectra breve]
MLHDLKVRMDIEKEAPFCHNRIPGKGARRCLRCNNHRGFNRKYEINLCRRCLHNKAEDIGFKSFD